MNQNPILKGNKIETRIFRPDEYELLRQSAKTLVNRTNLDACLLLGARYMECVIIQGHPEWFDGEYVKIKEKKVKRTAPERWIRMSNLGRFTLPHFFSNKRKLPGTPQAWRQSMIRWAEKAGIDPTGISPRTLRKTWESWLVTCYPHLASSIYLSQGHTELTSIRHYQGLPFTSADKSAMQKWVEGWGII